jgi:chorismate mutase / prephenate dehydratase
MQNNEQILKLRNEIDSVDKLLVSLIRKRAEISLQIGNAKKNSVGFSGRLVRDYDRESQILAGIASVNESDAKQIRRIFEEILLYCFEIQSSSK